MFDPRRHAAALLAVLALLLPATALAQDPTPTPGGEDQPQLSEDPPSQLDGGEEEEPGPEPTPAPEEEEDDKPSAKEREPLPETGVEAGLVALLGLGLIASGTGLRLTLRRAD